MRREELEVYQAIGTVEECQGGEIGTGGQTMGRLIEDVISIILLMLLPDCTLERLGLYDSMQTIIRRRMNNGKAD